MKFIISLVLRVIPRKYLQLVSHQVLRVLAVFYRGKKHQCPVCMNSFRKFLPYGRQARENALCPKCLTLERHRLLWLYLKNETNFFTSSLDVLHIAPELCFIERFSQQTNLNYTTADLESPLAEVKMDIHSMPFDEATFDVVLCNHVLEHVKDDRLALSEIKRVLKHGGWAILQIPIFEPRIEKTIEDPSIEDPGERERLFGQSDHVRMYGLDFEERLQSARFDVTMENYVEKMGKEKSTYYALPFNDPIPICHKRAVDNGQ